MSQERQSSPENEDPLRGAGPEEPRGTHASGGSANPIGARNGDARHTPSDIAVPPTGMVNGGHGWQPDDSPQINGIAVARFGMVLVIVVEAMTFAGLISAFLSIRASLDFWPPLDQPRYPVVATAINTAVLLASGVTMILFMWRYRRPDAPVHTLTLLLVVTLALGGLFVGLQGIEWVRLIGYGLTVTSSSYGSIFYVLIGFHAIHVLTAVLCLAFVTVGLLTKQFPRRSAGMEAVSIFWYFVVLVWPILYGVVYF